MRPTLKMFVLAPALILAAACSKDKPVDPSLNADLNLANQRPVAPLDSITAAERMNGGVAPAGTPAAGMRTGAVASPTPAPTHTTVRHTTSSSGTTHHRSSGSSSSGTTVVRSEGHIETHKNTNRDAAIGAAAGAVIGGTTGGLKGGIIGAAAGVEDFLRDGVIVRIFSLRPEEDRPEPLEGMRVSDCDVYLAVVHRLVLSGTRDLKFETITNLDQDWLSVSSSGNTIEASHYFLVFERPGPADVMTDYFRIQKNDARSYFDTGFKMTILADNPRLKAQDLARKFRERSNRLGDLKEKLDMAKSSIPCFSYEPLRLHRAATDQLSDRELVACSAEQPDTTWRSGGA